MRRAAAEPLPVAYLPGASGRGAVWQPIAARLAKRRPAVLCDYPDAPLGEVIRTLSAALPPRFDAIALSAGAAIALRLALAEPGRVRKLVLVCAAAGVEVRALGGLDWSGAGPAWLSDPEADVTPELGAIQAEVLLVCGDADLVAPVAVGELLAARLPRARLEIVPGATHDLELEEPDLLASLIEAHLRRTPLSAG